MGERQRLARDLSCWPAVINIDSRIDLEELLTCLFIGFSTFSPYRHTCNKHDGANTRATSAKRQIRSPERAEDGQERRPTEEEGRKGQGQVAYFALLDGCPCFHHFRRPPLRGHLEVLRIMGASQRTDDAIRAQGGTAGVGTDIRRACKRTT